MRVRRIARLIRQNDRVKPSEKHRRDVELISAFQHAYVDLLNSSQSVEGNWGNELGAKVSWEVWQQKLRAVAAAAGAGAESYHRHGGTWSLSSPGFVRNDVDPVANWEMSLSDPDNLPPQRIVTSVEAAIASARRDAEDAAKRERGATGAIAAFLRWPSDLREAVGPDHGAQRAAAGAVGVVLQIFVGTLTTALGAGLIAGVVALAGLVF
ncbi:MAG: hypothetical protein JWO11_3912 [Nocardioides sp.]|nr:hypothetical protein [Nocardioides sp.]